MYSAEFKNTREAYLALIEKVMKDGVKKSPRGLETREITNVMIQCANPRERMVSFQHGGSHPIYPYVEGMWMLLGEDTHDRLTHYSKFPAQFVNPSTHCMDGAYGPRIKPQLPKMYDILKSDKDSRRAVMNIFDFDRDTNIHSFDTPCTIFYHFMINNDKLDMTVYLRSQDLIKGFPNDSCEFQWFQEILAGWLGIDVGTYTHMFGSLHIYQPEFKIAQELTQFSNANSLYSRIDPINMSLSHAEFASALTMLDKVESWSRCHIDKVARAGVSFFMDDAYRLASQKAVSVYGCLAESIIAYNLAKAGYNDEAYEMVKKPECDIQWLLKDRMQDVGE